MSISRSSNCKIKFLLLIPTLIVILVMLVACDGIGTDIKNESTKLFQDLSTKLKQTDLPLSPQVATVIKIRAKQHYLSVILKPNINAIANKQYTADLYEKGIARQITFVKWNQPEINVLKEKEVRFNITKEEYDAYWNKDISHIFSVKVHE